MIDRSDNFSIVVSSNSVRTICSGVAGHRILRPASVRRKENRVRHTHADIHYERAIAKPRPRPRYRSNASNSFQDPFGETLKTVHHRSNDLRRYGNGRPAATAPLPHILRLGIAYRMYMITGIRLLFDDKGRRGGALPCDTSR